MSYKNLIKSKISFYNIKMHLFCQLSNLLGIFPIIYCIQNRAYSFAAIISAAVILSLIYHINENNRYALFSDLIGVSLLCAAGFYIIMNSQLILTWSNLMTVAYASAGLTCFVLAGKDLESEEYKLFHTGWHIFSIYGMATFLYSYFNTSKLNVSNSKVLCNKIPIKHLVIRFRTKKVR